MDYSTFWMLALPMFVALAMVVVVIAFAVILFVMLERVWSCIRRRTRGRRYGR